LIARHAGAWSISPLQITIRVPALSPSEAAGSGASPFIGVASEAGFG